MSELIFACPHNTKGINVATGKPWRDGDEFLSEAQAYWHLHGQADGSASLSLIDNRLAPSARFVRLVGQLESWSAVKPRRSAFTFFCHGLKSGLQVGANLTNVARLAEAMSESSAKDITVTLYACSAGADDDADLQDEREPGPGGDGGFADQLRDQLFNYGVNARVLAHATKGHCTRNPYVREFMPGEFNGGRWLVEPAQLGDPGSAMWQRWRRELQDGAMRFMLPKLSREQIQGAIGATA